MVKGFLSAHEHQTGGGDDDVKINDAAMGGVDVKKPGVGGDKSSGDFVTSVLGDEKVPAAAGPPLSQDRADGVVSGGMTAGAASAEPGSDIRLGGDSTPRTSSAIGPKDVIMQS